MVGNNLQNIHQIGVLTFKGFKLHQAVPVTLNFVQFNTTALMSRLSDWNCYERLTWKKPGTRRCDRTLVTLIHRPVARSAVGISGTGWQAHFSHFSDWPASSPDCNTLSSASRHLISNCLPKFHPQVLTLRNCQVMVGTFSGGSTSPGQRC